MTYKTLILGLDKILSPITVKFDDQEITFNNGIEMAEHEWSKNYYADTLEIIDGSIVVTLAENKGIDTNWCGEEQTSFF